MKKDKVPVICAVRIMNDVYSPSKLFYRNMLSIGRDDFVNYAFSFFIDGEQACLNNDIKYFDGLDISYTINKIARSVVKLYTIYYHKLGSTFFTALARIFNILLKELQHDMEDLKK